MTGLRSVASIAAVIGAVTYVGVRASPQAPVPPPPGAQAPAPGGGRQAAPPKPPTITDPEGHIVDSEVQKFKVEVVAKDLETPWGLAFLPDGRLLVTERPGRLRIMDKAGKVSEPIKNIPRVMQIQDGGLLDVEVHPQYARNGWIYL